MSDVDEDEVRVSDTKQVSPAAPGVRYGCLGGMSGQPSLDALSCRRRVEIVAKEASIYRPSP